MSQTHIHLILNHVVIMAALFSAILFIWGAIRKIEAIKNVALYGFILSAVCAIPVFLTGEPAEETVENLPGVMESIIELHEDAASFSIWLIELAGIVAVGNLLFKKIAFFKTMAFTSVVAILSVISSISILYTGYLGGQIRHTEIRSASLMQNGQQGEIGGSGSAEKDDD